MLTGQLLLALAAAFSLPLGARDGGGVSSILPPLRAAVLHVTDDVRSRSGEGTDSGRSPRARHRVNARAPRPVLAPPRRRRAWPRRSSDALPFDPAFSVRSRGPPLVP